MNKEVEEVIDGVRILWNALVAWGEDRRPGRESPSRCDLRIPRSDLQSAAHLLPTWSR